MNRLSRSPQKPPSTLTGPSRTLWQTIATEFAISDSAGLSILTVACEAHQRMRQAQAELAAGSLTISDTRGQLKAHPATAIERDSRSQFLAALKMLNLDLEPLEQSVGRPAGGKKAALKLVRV
jgi:P27 family predicted phage terminase small subunit